MKSLKEIASNQKKDRLFLLVIAVFIGVMIVTQSYLIVRVIDDIFLRQKSFQDVLPLLGGLLFIMLLRTFFNYVKSKRGIRMATRVKRDFRKELLTHFTSKPVHLSQQGQTGHKVSIMMDAVDEVDNYFSSYIPQVMVTTFVPILILIVVMTQHINSGLIMLITAPFIPIFMMIIGMKTKAKSEEQMEKLAAFSGRFLDTLQGLTTLKLFGQAKKQKETIKQSSLGFRDATMEILKVAFTSSFMLEVVMMLSIGIVALELAIQLIIYQSISFFTAFFILLLVPEFFTALKELGTTFHNGRTSMGAAQNIIDELANKDESVQWGEKSLDDESFTMSLSGVDFSYGEGTFTLADIHAKFPSNGQVAIVGRSGSGKSTLLQLIAGLLRPTKGEITINSVSLHEYAEKDWYNRLAYITQHPYIFSGTIAENIAIGTLKESTLKEVKQAAEEAGLHKMIQSLEKGYDTQVGEAGRGLSGGEKQRLALARAFLKQPSIILFDEPTTGLDIKTEQILQESMKKLTENSMVITVAHRLHTIKNADLILFLDKGRLIASGTHEKLMESSLEYKVMVSVQKGGREL
ncbi:thiol reductant ABC exporter subunit CydD [Ornithinibacillus halophilus]|uniref:ATP-binding cassette, subfamily C, CydD n=1 Tax=Ornithinibacillus halophilus TaxID=930117 RepID=A0A1M5DZB4_9BACI|nr:thiol reductant ABC exporter subunit CydD [Ornithinibacillus halophilus]SHF72337.1 ATP-binding cassette, subfamily C, CydD [Ornithinibacillus halophilus]